VQKKRGNVQEETGLHVLGKKLLRGGENTLLFRDVRKQAERNDRNGKQLSRSRLESSNEDKRNNNRGVPAGQKECRKNGLYNEKNIRGVRHQSSLLNRDARAQLKRNGVTPLGERQTQDISCIQGRETGALQRKNGGTLAGKEGGKSLLVRGMVNRKFQEARIRIKDNCGKEETFLISEIKQQNEEEERSDVIKEPISPTQEKIV